MSRDFWGFHSAISAYCGYKRYNTAIASELAETKALLEKADKKKVKLLEIEKINVKNTVFGNKVTISKEDFEMMRELAEKEVVSYRQTKKLIENNKKLTDENDELKQKVKQQSEELAELKKLAYFSRDGLKNRHRKSMKKKQQNRS